MKVRQRLKINNILTAITAFIILFVLLGGLYEVNKALKASDLAERLKTVFFERSTFRSDYLRTGNERAKRQWFAKQEQAGLLLKAASGLFRRPEDLKTVQDLIKDQEATGKIFSGIVESREMPRRDAASAALAQEKEDRLAAQLEMRLYDKILMVGALQDSADKRLYSILILAGSGIIGMLATLIIAAVIITWSVNRTIIDRMERLNKGVSVIGGGDLDYKIDVIGDDELSELSDAFNAMSERLKRSYQDLDAVFKVLPVPLSVHGKDGMYLRVNPAMMNLIGFDITKATREEIAEKVQVRLPDGHKFTSGDLMSNRALKGETVTDFEFQITNHRGEEHVLLGNAVPMKQGEEIYGAIVAHKDITEQKKAQEALLKANEELEARVHQRTKELSMAVEAIEAERGRFFSVLETLPPMIRLLTPDFHIVFANRSFRERFGESEGRRCYEYCFGRSEPCVFCEYQEVFKTGRPHHWEFTAPDGSILDAYDYPFTDTDGSSLVLEMDIDITEQRKAENAFLELNESLAQRVRERTSELEDLNESLKDSRMAALNLMEDALAARRQAEEASESLQKEANARREGELRLIGVLESMPDAFVSFDADLRYTYVNVNAERLQAASREELIGKDIRAVYPDAESYKTISQYERVIREQKPVTLTSYHAGFDRWVEIRVFPTPDGVSVFYKDVSVQVKAEEALRESEQKLKLFIEHAPAAIAMFDKSMRYVAVSRRWLSDYKLSEQDIVGRSHYEVFPEISERWKEIHRRGLEGATQVCEEDPFPRLDGSLDWVRWELHPWHEYSGDIGGIIIFTEMITQRKQAEEALRTTMQRFFAILSSMYAGILLVTDEGRVEFVNQTFCDLFHLDESPSALIGLEARETIEKIRRAYLHPDRAVARIQGILDGGVPVKGEELPMIDGQTFLRDFVPLNVEEKSYGRLWVHYEITERKRAEEKLRRSEERFRTTLDTMLEGCQIIGSDWRYLYLNDAADAHNRRPKEELLGRKYTDMWPGIETTEVFRVIKHCMEERVVHHMVNEFVFPDGAKGWFDLSIQPVPEGAFILSIDITERKLAEEAMMASKANLEAALASMTDAVFISDSEGRFLEFNDAFATFHKFKNKEECAKTLAEYPAFLDVFMADGEPAPLEKWAVPRALRGETVQNAEYLLRRKDTGESWVGSYSFAPIRDMNGVIVGSVVAGRDITDKRRIEENNKMLAAIVESSDDAIIGKTLDGVITSWNNGAELMYGYSREEIIGKHISVLAPPELRNEMADILERMKKGELIEHIETLRMRKDGTPIHVALSISPIHDAQGRITGASTIARDITQRKKAEEEVARLLADLERSNSELEQFAYVASHDLQEPLRMVSSFTQLLAKRYRDKLDQDAMDYIDFAVKGANRMQRMIQDLLNYSRVVTKGKAPVPTDMEKVLDETLANLTVAIGDSGASITHDALPVVMADPSQLVQVFQNLIGNAIKFRRDERLHIHVSAEQAGGEWVFSVKDNGMGIEPQYFERIFVLFERLHAGEAYRGTGIGLALCKRIISRLGGRIWLESEPGAGTSFYFTLKGVRQ